MLNMTPSAMTPAATIFADSDGDNDMARISIKQRLALHNECFEHSPAIVAKIGIEALQPFAPPRPYICGDAIHERELIVVMQVPARRCLTSIRADRGHSEGRKHGHVLVIESLRERALEKARQAISQDILVGGMAILDALRD